MKISDRLMLAGIALAGPALVLAEETGSGSSGFDAAEQIESIGESAEAAISAGASAIAPTMTAVILVGLGLWLIPAFISLLKRSFSSGKGR